jgi:hypothetical protein
VGGTTLYAEFNTVAIFPCTPTGPLVWRMSGAIVAGEALVELGFHTQLGADHQRSLCYSRCDCGMDPCLARYPLGMPTDSLRFNVFDLPPRWGVMHRSCGCQQYEHDVPGIRMQLPSAFGVNNTVQYRFKGYYQGVAQTVLDI